MITLCYLVQYGSTQCTLRCNLKLHALQLLLVSDYMDKKKKPKEKYIHLKSLDMLVNLSCKLQTSVAMGSCFIYCIISMFFVFFNNQILWFQMAVMISLGFLIAWTPYVAVSFWSMHNSQKQEHMAPSITLLPCLFAKSSTAYNPFIYFIFQRNTGHKMLPFHRVALSCCDRAESTREGEKAENKVTKGPDCICFRTGAYETCAGFPGDQSQRESAVLGWCICILVQIICHKCSHLVTELIMVCVVLQTYHRI